MDQSHFPKKDTSMSSRLASTVIILGISLSACAAQLTPAGTTAKLMKADPNPNCEDLGHVEAESGTEENVKILLRNQSGEKGANWVRLETVEALPYGRSKYAGTAFRCPQ